MFAFLISPLTWAVAGVSAYIGSQLDDKIDNPVIPAQDTHAQTIDIQKVMLYVLGGLVIYAIAKKQKII